MSIVTGHYHEKQVLHFWGDESNPCFAMNPGCLIDNSSLAYAYNKTNAKGVRLGAAMIIMGVPMLIPMLLGEDKRWLGKNGKVEKIVI